MHDKIYDRPIGDGVTSRADAGGYPDIQPRGYVHPEASHHDVELQMALNSTCSRHLVS